MHVQHDSELCDRLEMHSGVKEGCVLAVTLFSIEFPLLLNNAFSLFLNKYTSTQNTDAKPNACLLVNLTYTDITTLSGYKDGEC